MILEKVAGFVVIVLTVSVYTVLGLCGRVIRSLFKLVKKNDEKD